MPLLRLADDAVLDSADGTAIILDTHDGVYFELNPVATLMVEAAVRLDSVDEVIGSLGEQIDASADVLRRGLEDLIDQLGAHRLVRDTGGAR